MMQRPSSTRTLLVLVVTYSMALPAQEPTRWTLTPTLRLDATTEDFSPLLAPRTGGTSFIVGSGGEIVVSQTQDAVVRVYDSTGTLTKSLGRRGSGPGEFRNIFRLGWIRDTLWVYDAGQRRFTRFDGQWQLAHTNVLPGGLRQPAEGAAPRVITDFAPSALTGGGGMLGQIIVTEGRAPGGWLRLSYHVAAVDSASNVRRLAEIPPEAVSPRVHVPGASGASPYAYAVVPFANDALYTVSAAGDRFAILTTNRAARTYTVTTYRANGEQIFARTLPFVPLLLARDTIDAAINAATRNTRQPPAVIAELQKALREAVPPHRPPVTSVVLARDGRTWIRLAAAPGASSAVVLDATGATVATVSLPDGLELVDADDRRVWVTETDADGLTSIAVMHYR